MSFSPDSQLLVSGSADSVRVVSVPSGQAGTCTSYSLSMALALLTKDGLSLELDPYNSTGHYSCCACCAHVWEMIETLCFELIILYFRRFYGCMLSFDVGYAR